MKERTRQQVSGRVAEVVPHLPGRAVELPPPGPSTRQRLMHCLEALRVAEKSAEAVQAEEMRSLLDAIALRGADDDVKDVLDLLENGDFEALHTSGDERLELHAVGALLASGNPLVLGMSPRLFARYGQAQGETLWPSLRTKVGLGLVGVTLLAALPLILTYWAMATREGPFNALFLSALVTHLYLLLSGGSFLQALKRPTDASRGLSLGAAGAGAIFGVLLAPLLGVTDLPVQLALGAGVAASNVLLRPTLRSRKKATM